MLSSYEPNSIVHYLQNGGYKAKLEADDDGDPVIRTGVDGIDFNVYFYGCKKNQKCSEIQFSAGFDYPDGKGPNLEKMNSWNREWRFSRAFLDEEQDPIFRMDIMSADDGQISPYTFRSYLALWRNELAEFKRHISQ